MYKNFIIALFKIRKKNEERKEETEKSKSLPTVEWMIKITAHYTQ